jgi:hypothetical protein
MFADLPFKLLASFIITASVLYTVVAYIQLVLFERMVKRDYPQASSFKTMSQANKNGFKKVGWKILRGAIACLVTVWVKHYWLSGKV